jgi:hypothetical protein
VEYARIVNLATIAYLQEERPTFVGFRVETDHLNDSLTAPARSRLDPKVRFLSDALGKEAAHARFLQTQAGQRRPQPSHVD